MKTCLTLSLVAGALFSVLLVNAPTARAADGPAITWRKTTLDTTFRSEGVAVGDFNNDGLMDIAAGTVYYAAPDWKMHAIAEQVGEFDPLRYSDSFCCFADDINGDGWTDLLVNVWPGKETFWCENPRGAERPWRRHVVVDVTNNESPLYVDIDGSGQRALVMGYAPNQQEFDGPRRRMGIARRAADPYAPWVIQPISEPAAPSTTRFAHGLGVGDINGDGRNDVVVPQGWWEAPTEPTNEPWTFHPVEFGEKAAHMLVYDFDGDGDADVLSSSPHELGVWWHEQTPDGWVRHLIQEEFSQTHAMCLADINGDGLPDFVTGKRYWAHGPTKDVNPGDPAVLYWFELRREGGTARWIPHQIDDDSGIGTQFEVADVDGDGLLDVVVANKKGAFLFRQQRQP